MELETINKLYLELSQVATAQTAKELQLLELLKDANEKLRSAHSIAERRGDKTNWTAFKKQVGECLDRHHRVVYPPTKA